VFQRREFGHFAREHECVENDAGADFAGSGADLESHVADRGVWGGEFRSGHGDLVDDDDVADVSYGMVEKSDRPSMVESRRAVSLSDVGEGAPEEGEKGVVGRDGNVVRSADGDGLFEFGELGGGHVEDA
jgi:hypothetical protein